GLSRPVLAYTQAARTISGVVRDQTGAAIGGAQVTLKSSALTATKVTDAAGKFAFGSVPSETGTISVRSSGFITQDSTWRVNGQGDPALEIVLEPAGFGETGTVN